MKYTLLYILAFAGLLLSSCKSDETLPTFAFDDNALTLTPAAGGAVLHYKLPDDPDVVGIHCRYNDCYGQPILRTGSSCAMGVRARPSAARSLRWTLIRSPLSTP